MQSTGDDEENDNGNSNKKGDPTIVGFIQTGINNLPKNQAKYDFEILKDLAYGLDSLNGIKTSSSMDTDKFSKMAIIIGSDFYKGFGDFNFFGTRMNLKYEMGKRNRKELYKISVVLYRGAQKALFIWKYSGRSKDWLFYGIFVFIR